MGAAVPGDLVRFQVVFWLTSSTNASYLHVSTVKVRQTYRAPSSACLAQAFILFRRISRIQPLLPACLHFMPAGYIASSYSVQKIQEFRLQHFMYNLVELHVQRV